ncbi:Predicted nucleic acid-binding protein, contains PIN domain [Actinopolyspora alba]|uniref:Ribonuclease VapC n=2 Tax=Actinopolyspora alba TaxID=673379 RepID=A0A1I1Z2H3_9ACTN|nr:Predicted nucleic acid-binding protein, contains PIN domain [Actinopolyspora alba]
MLVVDTSTLVAFFLGAGHTSPMVRKTLGTDPHWAAPPHQPVEMLNVLRGLVRGRKISERDASTVLDRWACAAVETLDFTTPVNGRIWELRDNLSAYDAAYVAVAESHESVLVTGDTRLASAPRLRCEIRLVR